MSNRLPACNSFLDSSDSGVAWCFVSNLTKRGDNSFLGLEIGILGFTHTVGSFTAVIEKFLTSGGETVPYLVADSLGNGTDCFPFFLKLDDLIGRLAPVGAVLQSLGLFT